jgi:GNAT superfamily N-acetyltransferase
MEKIMRPDEKDWQVFLRLAAMEGWRVPAGEREFFSGSPAATAFVLKADAACLGFVTIVAYQHSGWIGNLLVAPEARGRGFGARLFARACRELQHRRVKTLWLTASEQGRPLYERAGFRSLDRVVRWCRKVEKGPGPIGDRAWEEALLAADRLAWGESRRPLLETLGRGARIFAAGGTVLMLQAGAALRVLGPWYSASGCSRENRRMLASAVAAADSCELAADVPAASSASKLLAAAGFMPAGECALMACGEGPAVVPRTLVSFASLGSLG